MQIFSSATSRIIAKCKLRAAVHIVLHNTTQNSFDNLRCYVVTDRESTQKVA